MCDYFGMMLKVADKMAGWLKGLNSWEEVAKDIADLLESPLGQDIAKK